MISEQTLRGNWNEISGMLRSKWGELTDDDVTAFNGNVDQLVGTIQRKTGAARESVEQFFEQFSANGASAIKQASESVRAGAQEAVDYVEDTSRQAAASVREGYAEVEQMVRQRPIESVAVCFGAGIITGVVVGLLLRR
ncbi:MAG: DUF883 family protein [Rhodopirellula sp.]|nr:DUF883 family protein [Rhodopirellula sp.]